MKARLHCFVVVLYCECSCTLLRLLVLFLLQFLIYLFLNLDALLPVEPLLCLRTEVFHVPLVLELLV